MQVTEITSEGLKREFAILVPRADLSAKVDVKLADIKDKVQLKGFRPGKVPLAHLKSMYGKGVMAEVVDETVNQAAQNAGALGWSLTADEVARLDGVALDGTRSLKQRIWQHG